MKKVSVRAAPLAPSERQAAIIAAVTPLLAERGSSATSRDLAEAAGIAEGTLFRAFGSKDRLIRAVAISYMDFDTFIQKLSAHPDGPLLEVVTQLIAALTEQARGMLSIASAFDHSMRHGHPHLRHDEKSERENHMEALVRALAEQLEPFADELQLSPTRAAQFIRGVCFSAAFPRGGSDETPLDPREMASLIINGIARKS